MKTLSHFLVAGKIVKGPSSIVVRVINREHNYFYEWDINKFKNRLFIIRELLEDINDDGVLDFKFDKETDPFWDPPQPIMVGQCFMKLWPLGV